MNFLDSKATETMYKGFSLTLSVDTKTADTISEMAKNYSNTYNHNLNPQLKRELNKVRELYRTVTDNSTYPDYKKAVDKFTELFEKAAGDPKADIESYTEYSKILCNMSSREGFYNGFIYGVNLLYETIALNKILEERAVTNKDTAVDETKTEEHTANE